MNFGINDWHIQDNQLWRLYTIMRFGVPKLRGNAFLQMSNMHATKIDYRNEQFWTTQQDNTKATRKRQKKIILRVHIKRTSFVL